MSTDPARRTAPEAQLAARAHPMRSRLLRLLGDHGPSTATELARRLGTNSGATSYHLRKLAEVGLVEECASTNARRRPWALTPTPLHDAALDGEGEESLDWLERDYLAYLVDKAQGWLDQARTWPARWRRAAGQRDYLVQVTDAQLEDLHAEIQALCERYRSVGSGNPRAKRVSVYTMAIPLDPPPRR